MNLFIDTTFGITVGLLDTDYNWIDYEFTAEKKGSALMHGMIYSLLLKNKSSVREVNQIFQVSGPGSYTGMRVSQGIASIFEWQEVKVNSFYHYEVPRMLGVEKGEWIINAFKGETFIYAWSGGEGSKSLTRSDAVEVSDIPRFTVGELAEKGMVSTQALIYQHPQDVFGFVAQNDLKRDLYYFRTIEMEFSRAKSI